VPDQIARSLVLSRLWQHAEERPSAIAVVERGARNRTLTWRELRAAAGLLVKRLRAGAGRPIVFVSSGNRCEMMIALLAGLWSDGIVVPISPEMPGQPLIDLLEQTGATALIGGRKALACAGDLRNIDRIPIDALGEPTAVLPAIGVGGSLLLTTSGTTGPSKLALRASSALDAVGTGSVERIGVRPEDRMLLAIPLHHSYGIDQGLLTAMIAGCTVELHDGFSVTRTLSAIAEGTITIWPAVPYLLDVSARATDGGVARGALRCVLSAGGLLPEVVRREFIARFGVGVGQIYGATEFGSATHADAAEAASGAAGRPLPGVEIRIVDAAAPNVVHPLAHGVEGQIAVGGATLFSSYFAEREAPTHDGFFLTGDLGRLDERGSLTITGRLSLLIDIGGRKVNPLEIESTLELHPCVDAAAVVALPYSRTVARLKAIVVPKAGSEPRVDELRAFLRQRLAPHKIPRSFEMRKDLPRSPTGKVLRQLLVSPSEAI